MPLRRDTCEKGKARAAVKILFVMMHPGFVRNYESALRLLATRGHAVHVASELDRKKLGENLQIQRLANDCESITYQRAPRRARGALLNLARVARTLLDYLRYLDPSYATAMSLRARVEMKIPRGFQRLVALAAGAGHWAVRLLASALRGLEIVLPSSAAVERFLRDQKPDVLLVTPLVDFGSDQVDYVKTARKLGVPSALCVASWDNLTNKGLMRVVPNRVFVWNQAQKDEAVVLHNTPPERVAVTGAQLFDHWFEWRPSSSRADFCRRVGLDSSEPYILYVGSSFFIAPDEASFGEKWIRRLRASDDPILARAGVLIRPHPTNVQQWLAFDFAQLGNSAVWPKLGADPFSEQFKIDFYDSMYYSAAVVGVNTSALIEAAIVGRPVCTVLAPEFAHSQEGTLHFRHLLHVNGGLLHVARNLDEHMAQLCAALTDGAEREERSRRFVEAFVRPQGLEKPSTPILVEAIEQLATESVIAGRIPWWAGVCRVALYPAAWVIWLLWQPGRKLVHRHDTPLWVYPVRPLLFILVRLLTGMFAVRAAFREVWRAVLRFEQPGMRFVRLGLKVVERRVGWRGISRRLTKLRKRSSKAGRQAVKRARWMAVKTASYLVRRPPAVR
jgi:hypothetical protein